MLLRVATFNIKHGSDRDGNVDLPRLGAACCGLLADVLAVQEVDRFARRTGFRDEMRVMARATRLKAVFGEAARGRWRTYGNVLLARGPITEVEVLKLSRPHQGEPRVAILAEVSVDGQRMSVGATHLSFRPGEGEAQLDEVLGALAERDGPRLLLGDLNLGPKVAEPALEAAGYTVVPTGPTFPAGTPRTRLDYVAVAGLDVVYGTGEAVDLGISDHLAVAVNLAPAGSAPPPPSIEMF
jgi:endonuclease/exonuclease/phosphatase family metal-dependent hydrolase